MKNKKIILFALLMLVTSLLLSCDFDKQIEEVVPVTISSGITQEYNRSAKVVEKDLTVNFGSTVLTDEEHADLLDFIRTLVNDLNTLNGESINFRYNFSDMKSGYYPDQQNQIFISNTNIDKFDIILYSLVRLFPQDVSFGQLVSYSYLISSKYGVEFDNNMVDFSKSKLEEHWYLSDLSTICFESGLATEEEVLISHYISMEVSNYITNEYGEHFFNKLMSKDYTDVFNALVYQWAVSRYPDFEGQNDNLDLVFMNYYEGQSISFLYQNLMFNLNLKNDDWGLTFIGDNSLKSSVKSFHEIIRKQIMMLKSVESIVGYVPKTEEKLPIYLYSIKKNNTFAARYDYSKNEIHIGILDSLLHEYIHYLDYAKADIDPYIDHKRFTNEMRATYYSLIISENTEVYVTGLKSMTISLPVDSVRYKKSEATLEFISSISESHFSLDDFIESTHFYSSIIERVEDVESFRLGYNQMEWISLMSYMTEQYGEDEVNNITLFDEHINGEPFDWQSLYKDWNDFLDDFDGLQKTD